MRRAHPCLGVAVVGACKEKGGSFPSFWTHFLFCSPCLTRLPLFPPDCRPGILPCYSYISIRQTVFTSAQDCQSHCKEVLQSVYVHVHRSTRAETQNLANTHSRPGMGLYLTWHENTLFFTYLLKSLFDLYWTIHLPKHWRKIPPPHKAFNYVRYFHFELQCNITYIYHFLTKDKSWKIMFCLCLLCLTICKISLEPELYSQN